MSKFRKKPVVIHAEQFLTRSNGIFGEPTAIKEIEGVIRKKFEDYQDPAPYYKYGIETLEGFMECKHGDWIITGVNGERYPCKPDIFEKTYEPAE